MKSKKKLLLVTTSLMTCAVAASIASSLFFSGSFPAVAGETINGSVTFTYSNFVSSNKAIAVFKSLSAEGTNFYMISDNDVPTRINEFNKAIASFGGTSLSASRGIRFYEDAAGTIPFQFQNITSITLVENNAGANINSTFEVYKNSTGSGVAAYSGYMSLNESKTISEVAGAHYLTIIPTVEAGESKWLEFKSITINYTCNPGGASTDKLATISVSSPKTAYAVGDEFVKPTVTAHYNGGYPDADVTDSAEFTGYDLSVEGNQTVVVSYTEEDVTKVYEYNITVSSSDPKQISAGTYTSGNYTFVLNGDGSGSFNESNYYNMINFTWSESSNVLTFSFIQSSLENDNNTHYAPIWNSSATYQSSTTAAVLGTDSFSITMYRTFGSVQSKSFTFGK